MTRLYPIVLETEESGAVSAYVPGLPVYAAADTHAKAERAIRNLLTAYLNAHPGSQPMARVRVARFSETGKRKVDIVGAAALVGSHRTPRHEPRGRMVASVADRARPRRDGHARRRRLGFEVDDACVARAFGDLNRWMHLTVRAALLRLQCRKHPRPGPSARQSRG